MISLHYTSHTKAYNTIYTACNIVEAIYSFTLCLVTAFNHVFSHLRSASAEKQCSLCVVFQLQIWENRPQRWVQTRWFWRRSTTRNSNMAATAVSTYISESMVDTGCQNSDGKLGFRPQRDRRKCSQAIASMTSDSDTARN